MEKTVISFRISQEEKAALEALMQPEDSSPAQAALRLLRGVLGVDTSVNTSVNAVNTDEIRERLNQLEQQLAGAIASRDQLQDFVNAIVDERIQHPLDILSDHQRRLSELEKREAVPVRSEGAVNDTVNERIQPVAESNQLTEKEVGGSAIAPKRTKTEKTSATITSENVLSSEAGSKQLSKNSLDNKVNSITRTLKTKGIAVSKTVVKAKILELFPYTDDWASDDARKEVIKALEKQPTWEDRASDLLDEVKWQ